MKIFYVTVLVLVAGAVPSHGRTESEDTVFNMTQPRESMNNVTVSSSKLVAYGDLILVMQWPKSFCNSLTVNRQCYQWVPNRFTVHGLWPQLSGRGIDCTDRRRYGTYRLFNRRLLPGGLVPDLNYFWPDLKSVVDDNHYFWESEYNKHGSCTINNQYVYFEFTLEWAKYLEDRLSRLFEIGQGPSIIPGNSYLLSDIKNAVREVTSKMPTLHCIRVQNSMQLLEIRFCAVQNGRLVTPKDCIFNSNCGSGQVYLPSP